VQLSYALKCPHLWVLTLRDLRRTPYNTSTMTWATTCLRMIPTLAVVSKRCHCDAARCARRIGLLIGTS